MVGGPIGQIGHIVVLSAELGSRLVCGRAVGLPLNTEGEPALETIRSGRLATWVTVKVRD